MAGANPGTVARSAHREWYREPFQPSVVAGLIPPAALAGYRNDFVFLRTSRYVPPLWEAVRDAMPALFDLLESEPEPAVRMNRRWAMAPSGLRFTRLSSPRDSVGTIWPVALMGYVEEASSIAHAKKKGKIGSGGMIRNYKRRKYQETFFDSDRFVGNCPARHRTLSYRSAARVRIAP